MADIFFNTSIKKIKEASENNKLVIFVGAGVSANSGVPTWSELIKSLSRDLGEFDIDKSPDLFLKIPQYYFNERGEKEYFEKLDEIFLKNKYKTNAIHKEIFKLKPTHIITTNYDTLLEEAAIEEGQFFHTVKYDLHLPYNNFNKTIIKMHGDFEHRNIVLKEDDYLNYSTNFTLIESYIKSLIATNTVLFIGYSVNDPNFNLIFQWVKNILSSHFQPAYLIENSKKFSRIEHSYYKNRGINILYKDEIEDLTSTHVFDKTNVKGNALYDLLSYFNAFEKRKEINDLESVYEKLSCFEDLNFIMPDQIVKRLGIESLRYDLFGDKYLTTLNNENPLIRVFSNIESDDDKVIFSKISKIFLKANIQGISKEKELIIAFEDNDYFINNLITKIIKTDSTINPTNPNNLTSILEGKDYESMLSLAHAFYKQNQFNDSYTIFKTISMKAFQDKKYLTYYISEFNRKHLGNFLMNNSKNISEDLKIEIQDINLEEIYDTLPSIEKKSISFLTDVQNFNFIYNVQNKINKHVNALKNTKRTVENNGFSIDSTLQRSFTELTNIWMFLESNYLCIDIYSEIKSLYLSFVEGIFVSYSTQNNNSSETFFNDLPINKIERLDIFEVYITVTKLKTKNLSQILTDYNVNEIVISEPALEFAMDTLETLVNNVLNNKMKDKSENYLYNLITLLSKSILDMDHANRIGSKLKLLFNEKIFFNEFKYINRFIVSSANKKLLNQNLISQLLNSYLNAYLKNRRILDFDTVGLYSNLAKIHEDYNSYPLDEDTIANVVNVVNIDYNEENRNLIYSTLQSVIYPIFGSLKSEEKEIIKVITESILEKIISAQSPLDSKTISFYESMLLSNVLEANTSINKLIIEGTCKLIEIQNESVKIHPDPINIGLHALTNMYKLNHLNLEEIKDYLNILGGHVEYFDLIFNIEGVKLTNLNLLMYLNEEEMEALMRQEKFKNSVYELFEEKLEDRTSKKDKAVFTKIYTTRY